MFQAKPSALNRETKAAGVSKFGVFGFRIHVVIQLKLPGGKQGDVLRLTGMHQDLLCMRDDAFFRKRGQRLFFSLPERMVLRHRQNQVGFQRPVL